MNNPHRWPWDCYTGYSPPPKPMGLANNMRLRIAFHLRVGVLVVIISLWAVAQSWAMHGLLNWLNPPLGDAPTIHRRSGLKKS